VNLHRDLFPGLWFAWVVYWFLAARVVKPTERREPIVSRMLHVVPLALAAWLLWSDRLPVPFLDVRLFPWAPWQFWLGAIVTALGMLFTVWARVHLGRNWSAMVTVKHGHELIDTGPYRLVRHPIYSGLLVAFIATAFAVGEWRGVLAVLIAWAALWRKLRFEERWMSERFGEAYAAYRKRVPALIPFLGGDHTA
jgi:protein-S-isoprenylcysteine O-methyltransferase Ste14